MRCRALLLTGAAAAMLAAAPARAAGPEAAAANEAGVRLFRSGTVAEAIEKFDEALALDPGFAEARRNLAAALASRGQEQVRQGDVEAARAHLERATDLVPTEAPYQLLLGLIEFRRGDLFAARQRIDRALALAPTLAAARELSGDLHYQQGWLERARAEWEAALADAGERLSALRAKLDRLQRESEAEGGFGRDVSRHFTIQFDGPVPAEVARTALRLLEAAHDRLRQDLGRPPQHDIPVILYSRTLFDEITRSPGWVAGTYDGKIRVPVGGLSTAAAAERLGPILAHELTHAFLRAAVPGRLPLWFEEGLAQHFEGTPPQSALRALRAAGGFTSLEELDAALRGGARVDAAYAAAARAVGELVRLGGLWLPRRILELVAAGRPFPAAFRDASGMDLAEFERRWAQAQQRSAR